MAKLNTMVQHTLLLTEEERLTVVSALRYKQTRVTDSAALDELISVLTRNGGTTDG